jgi:phosphoribosyl-AMP cyclohydrolase
VKSIADVVWDPTGRAPVIVQDAGTGAVLALESMDRASLAQTLATGWAAYTPAAEPAGGRCAAAGPRQMVTALYLACDGRALLLHAQPAGPLCQRTGAASCFSEALTAPTGAPSRRGLLEQDGILWSAEAAQGAGSE